jgi:serine/threonine-protein kinase RsbW
MPATEDPIVAASPREVAYREPGDLSTVRAFIRDVASQLGLTALRVDLLTVAVSELTTNTLQHTTGGGRVRVWAGNGRLYCEVTDRGPLRALGRSMPSADAIRGRGMAIVERICDEVEISGGPDGTCVRLMLLISDAQR